MASSELSEKLARRQAINDGLSNGHVKRFFNPYIEFSEFSRKEIKSYEQTFKKFDIGQDNFIDLMELKLMMEKVGAPQTHLALKQMISEVDEDRDGKISFREFLLMYRKGKAGDLSGDSGFSRLAALTEIDVDSEGVGKAKQFFEAKIEAQRRCHKFEEEIRAEQEEKKQLHEDQKTRREAFKEKTNFFEGPVFS